MLRHIKDFNLPALEEKVQKLWKERDVFRKSVEQRASRGKTRTGPVSRQGSKKPFVFFEGPPTANGRPGVHHVLTRAFKDVVLRYQTMRGRYVPRRAGWDTHGLPVELQVEKELGLKSKKDIEEYGVAKFNAKCKESVWQYRREWEELTSRMGFWIDMTDPYITYENSYIESVWGILQTISKKKLLYKGHRVVPWCSRCGTALSSHELAQGYETVKDTSVFVKFRLKTSPNSEFRTNKRIYELTTGKSVYILSWTTTPWTLPGNVALAVGEDIDYVVFRIKDQELSVGEDELYIAAKALLPNIASEVEVVSEVKGSDLVGLEYEQLFSVKALKNEKSHKVYAADFVTTEDGTGVVHTAVMYGEDDYRLGDELGLPKHHTVSEDGRFTKDVHEFQGMKARHGETEKDIIAHLDVEGYLLKTEKYEHEYPHCWRCGTALLYYAHDSWFISMTKLREKLMKSNAEVNWVPGHIRDGRFGEWLRDVKDWALSRNRYWGIPLPMWECNVCEHQEMLTSREEIIKRGPKPRNTYYLLRHGQAESNLNDVISTNLRTSDQYPLTLDGRVAAEKAGKKLKKKKVDMVFASPFYRTKETADIVADAIGCKVELDDRLREIDLGDLDGRPNDVYRSHNPSQFQRLEARHPNTEGLRQIAKRMYEFVREMEEKHKGKKILIISHEYPLWMLDAVMQGWSEEEAIRKRCASREDYILPAELLERQLLSVPRESCGFGNLHKPYIDEVSFLCKKRGCKGEMKRVEEVIDVWFDSGAMPFAQAASLGSSKSEIRNPKAYPADYIVEGVDQTRGWFYTLLAIATLLGKKAPYKTVLSLGHILDAKGQKMSKSKGNTVDPWEMIEKYGVDALRWHFYTMSAPGDPKRFNEDDLKKVSRQLFGLVYNSFSFLHMYGEKTKKQKSKKAKKQELDNVLDRWVLARLNETIELVREDMDEYEMGRAARNIQGFADDVSRWYIRRSRRR